MDVWGAHKPGIAAALVIWLSRRTALGRGAIRKALFKLACRLHRGPFDVHLWGAPVRLHPQRNVSERKALMRPDKMDAPEHALLREAMAMPGAVFVDVGGNVGLYTLDAALHAASGARVLMIEPDPALIARLKFNLETARRAGLVRDDVSVETFPVAISDRDGEGVLSSDGEEGSRSLAGDVSAGGRKVPLVTLAALIAGAGVQRIAMMKIDVEGFEDKVLPPYFVQAPAELWPLVIVIEHLQRATWRPDCIADAIARGYTVKFETPNNTVLTRAI